MNLEQVERHPERKDLYRNQVITPHEKVEDIDKNRIKNILLKILENQ